METCAHHVGPREYRPFPAIEHRRLFTQPSLPGYSPNLVEVEFCELRHNGVLGSSLRPGSLPLLTRALIYTTAVASISIKNSGKAKRVTPSSVLAGRQPAADKRVVIVSQASKHLSTSVV